MKEIPLSQGKIAIVDDEDFERVNQFKWFAWRQRKTWYARRTDRSNGKQTTIGMHRVVMDAPAGVLCDHINGDGLNNRKENLRLCTHQQNGFNQRKPHKNNNLGIKGVRWHERAKKFIARIGVNGKVMHLGYFNVMGDADSAYRIAEEKYFGEFARRENE